MGKLALNFICKNEAHVIERMLNSSKSIVDLIVVNDTGSTDGTQEMIKKFGLDNNIPTYVFERPFDDFDKSRNFAMDKLRDVVKELKWDADKVHGFWYDADEQLVVGAGFDKNQFTKDLYMIDTYINSMKYTRNTFFKVSKPFSWYGVVHEFIVCKDNNITSGLAENIHVSVSMDGNSWQSNISSKYLHHAHRLETYLNEDRKDPRWIFYTAQSYHDSACVNGNKEENDERLRRSLKYYKERVSRPDGYHEEVFYSQFRIGSIMRTLEEPWNLTLNELLKAYNFDTLRGESIKVIIDYYLSVGEYNNAYIFSSFGKKNFHNKNPYPNRLLFIDEILYAWKFLEVHAAACYYTNRRDEARLTHLELVAVANEQTHLFSQADLQKIQTNEQFFK